MAVQVLTPFTPWIAAAGIGWLYYRRIRRQFGRQVYRPKRTALRLALLALVSCGLVVAAFDLPQVAVGLGLGALIGAGLGWLALRHTAIAVVDGVREYTPNAWIGGGLSLLLVARLAWRWYDGAFGVGAPTPGAQASPLTFSFMAMLIAYYLVQGVGLALRMRALSADAGAVHADESTDASAISSSSRSR